MGQERSGELDQRVLKGFGFCFPSMRGILFLHISCLGLSSCPKSDQFRILTS